MKKITDKISEFATFHSLQSSGNETSMRLKPKINQEKHAKPKLFTTSELKEGQQN